jgi:hypothetical protein
MMNSINRTVPIHQFNPLARMECDSLRKFHHHARRSMTAVKRIAIPVETPQP